MPQTPTPNDPKPDTPPNMATTATTATTAIDPAVLAVLRCPVTRSELSLEGSTLVARQPEHAPLRYPIRDGIPVLLAEHAQLPNGISSLDEFKAKYPEHIAD